MGKWRDFSLHSHCAQYPVDGKFLTVADILMIASRRGIRLSKEALRSRIRRGYKTLEDLLKPGRSVPQSTRVRDKDIVAALLALDSRKQELRGNS